MMPLTMSENFYKTRKKLSQIAIRCGISQSGRVALSHRGRKIAYAVTERCLSEANRLGGAYYVMRTAAKGSNSRHMFLRMGSTEISEVQDVSAQT